MLPKKTQRLFFTFFTLGFGYLLNSASLSLLLEVLLSMAMEFFKVFFTSSIRLAMCMYFLLSVFLRYAPRAPALGFTFLLSQLVS